MRFVCSGRGMNSGGGGEVDWIPFALLLPKRCWRLLLPVPLVRAFFVSFFHSNDSVFMSCNLTAENRAWS